MVFLFDVVFCKKKIIEECRQSDGNKKFAESFTESKRNSPLL